MLDDVIVAEENVEESVKKNIEETSEKNAKEISGKISGKILEEISEKNVEENTDLVLMPALSKSEITIIIEAALFASDKPLKPAILQSLFSEERQAQVPSLQIIKEILAELMATTEDKPYEIVELASGYRLQVKKKFSVYLKHLWQEKPQKYSRVFLETLAIITYRQPITRAEIEELRGVSVNHNIIKTLQEREWIKIIGHRDVPGKPAIYGTTKIFLDYFNLKSLEQLPSLPELTQQFDKPLVEEEVHAIYEQKE